MIGMAIEQEVAVRRVRVAAHRRADGNRGQAGQVTPDVRADRGGIGRRRLVVDGVDGARKPLLMPGEKFNSLRDRARPRIAIARER